MIKSKWLPYAIATVLLATYFYLFRDRLASLQTLPSIDLFSLAVLSALVVVFLTLNGVRIFLITSLFGVRLPLREWLGLAFLTSMGNYLPMQGGMVGRGVYLYKRHNIPLSHYASMVTGGIVIFLTANALLGITVSLWLLPVLGKKLTPFVIMFSIVLAGVVVSYLIPISQNIPQRSWYKVILQVLQGWERIRCNRTVIVQLLCVETAIALVFALRLYTAAWIVGMPLSFGLCAVITSVLLVVSLFPITPGSIGIREGAAGLMTITLAAGAQEGLMATGLDRIVATLWIFLLGSISSYFLIHNSSSSSNQKELQNSPDS